VTVLGTEPGYTARVYRPAVGCIVMATPDHGTSAPFAASLRAAVAANSLTSEAVSAQLTRRGIRTTPATVDRWKAGDALPESLATAAALEDLLLAAPGALASVLGAGDSEVARAVYPTKGPDGFRLTSADRLRLSFHPDALTWSRPVHMEDEVIHGPGRHVTEIRRRMTEEVLVDGVDRCFVVDNGERAEDLIQLRALPVSDCSRGRIRMDPQRYLICTELLLGQSLLAGENFSLEYSVVIDRPSIETKYFARRPRSVVFSSICVKFDQTAVPAKCFETVYNDQEPPHGRELRIRGTQVKSAIVDLNREYHAIFWEWG
jgi:hypothetical protein